MLTNSIDINRAKSASRSYWIWLIIIVILTGGILLLDFRPTPGNALGVHLNVIYALIVGLIAVISLRFLRKDKAVLSYLVVLLPYLIIVSGFIFSGKLDGDSWRTHFPKFNYMCDAISNGCYFPQWFPSSGGIRIGYFHIGFNQTLPHRLLGYLLYMVIPVSTVLAYKAQYVFGIILMCFGWWLVLRKITCFKYSAYLGTLMVLMGGTGITFHQEHVLATTYLIPWFVLCLLKLRSDSAYLLPAVILLGLGLSTHYPQIQYISMGTVVIVMIIFKELEPRKILRESKKHLIVLPVLLILGALPAIYMYKNSDVLASVERNAYDTLRSRSYEDYTRLHSPTFSAAPMYFHQYLYPRWSKSDLEPHLIDVLDRCSFFVGRMGIILAAAGIIMAFRKGIPIFIMLTLFTGMSLGMYSPGPIPKMLFHARFPLIDVFRQWYHFFPMVNFCLAALAALGFDRIISKTIAKSAKLTSGVIALAVFALVVDMAAYGKKYISLQSEDTKPTDMLKDFYEDETAESGLFQYKDRLQLQRECGDRGIPDEAYITTNIVNMGTSGLRGINIIRLCKILSSDPDASVAFIPRRIFSEHFQSGEHVVPTGIDGYHTHKGFEAQVSPANPALLILPLNYGLGSKAYVNGEKTDVWRVNNALSGILLSEGTQKIEFKIPYDMYWPSVWIQWSLYICVTAFLILKNMSKSK